MRPIGYITVAVLLAATVVAQEPKPASAIAQDAELRFEVASVRESASGGRGGQRNTGPGRLTYERALFRLLLMDAFGVQRDQIKGPNWATADAIDGGALFDVSAIVPAGATKEQVATMLRNLLKDRFKLSVHREARRSTGFNLVIARTGSKLMKSAGPVQDGERASVGARGRVNVEVQPDGFPRLFPGRNMGGTVTEDGTARLRFRDYPLSDFVQQLAFGLNVRIADTTELSGTYDFTLTFTPSGAVGLKVATPLSPGQVAPLSSALPSDAEVESLSQLSSALEKQLGLKLEASEREVETLVIDHVERTPTPN